MANLGGFDPTTVDPNQPEPIPEADYLLQIVESGIKPTAKGNGTMLNLTLEVLEGPHKGRRVYENINIVNSSSAAQQIGQKQLSAICHACGHVRAVNDSTELHFKPFRATVGIIPAEGKFRAKNEVRKYHFAQSGGVAPVAGLSAARPAPPANGAMPWSNPA